MPKNPDVIQRTITFTTEIERQLTQLMTERGSVNKSSFICQIINETFRKAHPAYIQSTPGGGGQSLSIEDEATRREAISQARKTAKLETELAPKRKICEALEGTITKAESGTEVCIWWTYDRIGKYDQQLPVMRLSADLLDAQFAPDRETVARFNPIYKQDHPNENNPN